MNVKLPFHVWALLFALTRLATELSIVVASEIVNAPVPIAVVLPNTRVPAFRDVPPE